MPIYEYQCKKCRGHHEVMQKITDAPLTVCPGCGGNLEKLISNTSFVLKGTGWYATDYASKGKQKSDASPEATAKTESPKEAATGDAKQPAETKKTALSS